MWGNYDENGLQSPPDALIPLLMQSSGAMLCVGWSLFVSYLPAVVEEAEAAAPRLVEALPRRRSRLPHPHPLTAAPSPKVSVDFVPPYSDLLPGGAASAGLVLASDGNYYGAERHPGQNVCRPQFPGVDCGVIVRVSPSGAKTILHQFGLSAGDGFDPGQVVLGDDGAFYGTTKNGGAFGTGGTIFRMTLGGN